MRRTSPTEEFAGAGFSLGMPPLCFRSFCRNTFLTKHLGLEHRSASCAKDALALYREFKSHGIQTLKRPFVGNRLWVVPVTDPDGYRIDFESPTDAPEESEFEE